MQASEVRQLALARNDVFDQICKEATEQDKFTTIYTPAKVMERNALEEGLRDLGYRVEIVKNEVSNGRDHDGSESTKTVYRLQIGW
jgi:hypothetical protein